MGVYMGAYVKSERTFDGYNLYEFAPMNSFTDLKFFDSTDEHPSFKLTTCLRAVIYNVLNSEIVDGMISFEVNELPDILRKLTKRKESFCSEADKYSVESYESFKRFIEICIERQYHVSAA